MISIISYHVPVWMIFGDYLVHLPQYVDKEIKCKVVKFTRVIFMAIPKIDLHEHILFLVWYPFAIYDIIWVDTHNIMSWLTKHY